jgi:hypothetical protein
MGFDALSIDACVGIIVGFIFGYAIFFYVVIEYIKFENI